MCQPHGALKSSGQLSLGELSDCEHSLVLGGGCTLTPQGKGTELCILTFSDPALCIPSMWLVLTVSFIIKTNCKDSALSEFIGR